MNKCWFHCRTLIPPILKPNFNLLRLDVGEGGAFPDELLPPQWARFWAFTVDSLEGFDLLRCVPDIFSLISRHNPFVSRSHSYHVPNNSANKGHLPAVEHLQYRDRKSIIFCFFFPYHSQQKEEFFHLFHQPVDKNKRKAPKLKPKLCPVSNTGGLSSYTTTTASTRKRWPFRD